MEDPKFIYFAAAVASASGCGLDEILNLFNDLYPIERFLYEADCVLLVICLVEYDNSRREIIISNSIIPRKYENGSTVSFIKSIDSIDLSCASIEKLKQSILTVSVPASGGIITSLKTLVRSFYSPSIFNGLEDGSPGPKLSEKTKNLILELDSEFKTLDENSFGFDKSLQEYSNKLMTLRTPVEEVKFWETIVRNQGGGGYGTKICNCMLSSKQIFEMIEIDPHGECLDESIDFSFLENSFSSGGIIETCLLNVFEIADDEGNQIYNQKQMLKFMENIMHAVCNFVCKVQPRHPRLFSDPFLSLKSILVQSRDLIQVVLNMFERLSSIYFTSSERYKWTGTPFSSSYANKVCTRLDTILQLRSTHFKMFDIISQEKLAEFKCLHSFKPFMAFNSLHFSPRADERFEKAMKHYNSSLLSIDKLIIEDMKCNVIAPVEHSPLLLLSTLQKYSGLIHRPNILPEMLPFLQGLEEKVDHLITVMTEEIDSNDDPVEKILKTRQISSRATKIQNAYQVFEFPNEICSLCSDLISNCKQEGKKSFRIWLEEVTKYVEHDKGYHICDKVVDIDQYGNLFVQSDQPFEIFLKDASRILQLGFCIPNKLQKKYCEAQHIHRYRNILQQMVNMYNSISNSIMPVQRSMLAEALNTFKDLLNNPQTCLFHHNKENTCERYNISWNNPAEYDFFVNRLHSEAQKLGEESKILQNAHHKIGHQFSSLILTDFVSERSAWMEQSNHIIASIEEIIQKYSSKNCYQWMNHWNYQFFKAVHFSFCVGLKTFCKCSDDLKCEFVIERNMIHLHPNISIMRKKYYSKLNLFAEFPYKHQILKRSNLMKDVISNATQSLQFLYQQVEIMFLKLEEKMQNLLPFLILESMHAKTNMLSKACKNAEDFTFLLSLLCSKQQQIDQLPNKEKIYFCVLSYQPFKKSMSSILEYFHEGVIFELHNRILRDVKVLDEYLLNGVNFVTSNPCTLEEILITRKSSEVILAQRGPMFDLSLQCEEMMALLIKEGSHIDSFDAEYLQSMMSEFIKSSGSRWSTIDAGLEKFNNDLSRQTNLAKELLESQEKDMHRKIKDFGIHLQDFISLKVLTRGSIERKLLSFRKASEEFQVLSKESEIIVRSSQSLCMKLPTFSEIGEIGTIFKGSCEIWSIFQKYFSHLDSIGSESWITFRKNINRIDNFCSEWEEKIKSLDYVEACKDVIVYLNGELQMLKDALPTIKHCYGDSFREDHWEELLQGKMGVSSEIRIESLFCYHFLQNLKILSDPDIFDFARELSNRAQNEVNIRTSLQEISVWLKTSKLNMSDHVFDDRRTFVITKWDDLFTDIGDKQCMLGTLRDSTYASFFYERIKDFELKISLLAQYLELLHEIQSRWVYLEPIFIRGALKNEKAVFDHVDAFFCEKMVHIHADPNQINLVEKYDNDFFEMKRILERVETCKTSLRVFLDEKREFMPRFYFLSDDELLELLGQCSSNVEIIQKFLPKLFQAIHQVSLRENKYASAMMSSDAELVPFAKEIEILNDSAEIFLGQVVRAQCQSLQNILGRYLGKHISEEVMHEVPAQIMSVIEKINFCHDVEKSLELRSGLVEYREELLTRLKDVTSNLAFDKPLKKLKIKAVILDTIANRDIVSELIQDELRHKSDWTWQKRMRYYSIDSGGLCVVKIGVAELPYSFEYQGNQLQLINTPLTNKCYFILANGLMFGFGGNLYGPAGCGKTETVKSLGSALGRRVTVFNCDEGIDIASMKRIFVGLVQSGSWGCFDEFNRLKVGQLSAISHDIQKIQDALKAKAKSIDLMEKNVSLDLNAAIFVTLNPLSALYGGRSILPENLKILFRHVAVDKPDLALICKVFLYAEGFSNCEYLGKCITQLFHMSDKVLAHESHYDWGLRGLKVILQSAGKLMSKKKQQNSSAKSISEETKILIRAIKANISPKLNDRDKPHFLGMISDIFMFSASLDGNDDEFKSIVKKALANDSSLVMNDDQVQKVIEMKDMFDQRTGCILVGPTGSGKSTSVDILKKSLTLCGKSVKLFSLNPKSMTKKQLLGYMDYDTREWKDGVLTKIARKAACEAFNVTSWVICDGDIDPEWIESLNSVLDDNKILTLPNGERISFGNNVNFIFETDDLQFTSPATISRMGIVLFKCLDMSSQIISKWISSLVVKKVEFVEWINEFYIKAIKHVLELEMVVKTSRAGVILNGVEHVQESRSKIEFLYGLRDGLGGNIKYPDRIKFAQMLLNWGRLEVKLNQLDYFYNKITNAEEIFQIQNNVSFTKANDIVLTKNIQRAILLLTPWTDSSKPFILVGPYGSGKISLLKYLYSRRGNPRIKTIYCTFCTSPEVIKEIIHQSCNLFTSSSGQVYRPKYGKVLVIILVNIDKPALDRYGSSIILAFLQHFIKYNGFFNDESEFIHVQNVQIISTINSKKRTEHGLLSSRFLAINRIGVLDYPDKDDLVCFVSAVLKRSFDCKEYVPKELKDDSGRLKLALLMVNVFESVRDNLVSRNCVLNDISPKILMSWMNGLANYNIKEHKLYPCVVHEAHRQFADRFPKDHDKSIFREILKSAMCADDHCIIDDFRCYYSTILENLKPNCSSEGNYYTRLTPESYEHVAKIGVDKFCQETDVSLTLFQEFISNLARVSHSFIRTKGNILLLGKSGVGKNSLIKLACSLNRFELISPALTIGYSTKEFKTSLKQAIHAATVERRRVCFVIQEYHLTEPGIFEILNSILSSYEVLGLYNDDELANLLQNFKCGKKNNDSEFDSMYENFQVILRSHFTICTIMDSTKDNFRQRCNHFPALSQKSHIVCIADWNVDSLKTICTQHVIKNLTNGNSESIAESYISGMVGTTVKICKSMTRTGASSFHLLKVLGLWEHLLRKRKKEMTYEKNQLQKGIETLNESARAIDRLKEDAESQQLLLNDAQNKADKAMQIISEALGKAEKTRIENQKLKNDLSNQAKENLTRKAEIEEKLREIQPTLNRAKDAVQGIQRDNLNEIRSLKSPPSMIVDVLSGVLMILGKKDLSWISMKKFLGNREVKKEILNFNVHSISKSSIKSVEKLLTDKPQSFHKDKIYRVSVAAAPLATWVKATLEHATLMRTVSPLENELDVANKAMIIGQQRLNECENELKNVNDKVSVLKQDFGNRTREAESYRIEFKKTDSRLSSAKIVFESLSSEHTRWELVASNLNKEIDTLGIKTLLSSLYIVYLSRENENKREKKSAEWVELFQNILDFKSFDLLRAICGFELQSKWNLSLFHDDTFRRENSLIVSAVEEAKQIPFIIDPEQVSLSWLQKNISMKTTGELEIISSKNSRLVQKIELCVRLGKTLVITDSDGINPFLYSLVKKETRVEGGVRRVVPLGEKIIEYSGDFRLIFISKKSSIQPPPISSFIYEINFTVSCNSLESQLLKAIVQCEEPELEANLLVYQEEEQLHRTTLDSLEKLLIQSLNEGKGNLLENDSLIETLSKTKKSANAAESSFKESRNIGMKLSRKQNTYRNFAKFGSRCYFQLSQLHILNHMYRFSLGSFLHVFRTNLANPTMGEKETWKIRLEKLKMGLLSRCFLHFGRSLFKVDRLSFAMYLVNCSGTKVWSKNTWDFFIGRGIGDITRKCTSIPEWIKNDSKNVFLRLNQNCPDIIMNMQIENKKWREWTMDIECENHFPRAINLSPIEKLLIIKTFRPDRLMIAMNKYCCNELSIDSIEAFDQRLNLIWDENKSSRQPFLLIAKGIDCFKEVQELAHKIVGRKRFKSISLGQGEKDTVMKMCDNAREKGDWLCLNNLHLVAEWLPKLEEVMFMNKNVHEDFNLWLITEPHNQFSRRILEQSIKVTCESSLSLKRNMQKNLALFQGFLENKYDAGAKKSRLMLILMWFHAILQGRDEYATHGWSQKYDFSIGDLQGGILALNSITNESNWKLIHGMVMEFAYGGKITNIYDRRIIHAYIQIYFNDEFMSGCKDINGVFGIPEKLDQRAIYKAISRIPDYTCPSTFGLPQNVESSTQIHHYKYMMNCLLKLDQNESAFHNDSKKKWHANVGPILNTWLKIKTNKKYEDMFESQSNEHAKDRLRKDSSVIGLFIEKEKSFGLKIFDQINIDLNGIDVIQSGLENLSLNEIKFREQLSKERTPNLWNNYWNGPGNVLYWLKKIVDITHHVFQLLSNEDYILAQPIQLDLLFHPHSLFAVFLQYSIKANRCSVQDLQLLCEWNLESCTNLGKGQGTHNNKIFLKGIMIQGAHYSNKSKMIELVHKSTKEYSTMPTACISYVAKSDIVGYECYNVPLYDSCKKENLIVDLPLLCSKKDKQKFVLAGVSLFINM